MYLKKHIIILFSVQEQKSQCLVDREGKAYHILTTYYQYVLLPWVYYCGQSYFLLLRDVWASVQKSDWVLLFLSHHSWICMFLISCVELIMVKNILELWFTKRIIKVCSKSQADFLQYEYCEVVFSNLWLLPWKQHVAVFLITFIHIITSHSFCLKHF